MRVELAVLVCVISIWIVTSLTVDIDNAKIEMKPQLAQAYANQGKAYHHESEHDQGWEDVWKAQNSAYKARAELLNDLDMKVNVEKGIEPASLTSLELQGQERLNDLDMKLRDLDRKLKHVGEDVPRQRQEIENWYASELARSEKWKKQRLEQLNKEEELARARCYQGMQNTTSEAVGYHTEQGRSVGDTFIISDGRGISDAYSNTYTSRDGLSLDKERTFVVGDPTGRYQAELRRIKIAKDAIELEFVKLQRQRDRYLAEIERDVDNARTRIRNAMTRIPAAKRSIQKNTEIRLKGGPGLIGSVSISGDGKGKVWIEDKMLHEGDWINGFKITGIYWDRVEFEKSGEIFVQSH